MLSENLRKSIINKYFDAMLRTTVCDYTEYARIRGCNPITVKSWVTQGVRRIAEAAGTIEGLGTQNVIHSFENTMWKGGFGEELDIYIRSHESVFWKFVPHDGDFPSVREFMDYLIENYRGEIARSIIDGYRSTVHGTEMVLKSLRYSVDSYCKNDWQQYHRYQVRFYDYCDCLVGKYTFSDEKEAAEYAEKALGNMSDRYSRYIIRTNSLFSGEWYICGSGGNASVAHVYKAKPDKWRVSYYDYEDRIIKTVESESPDDESVRTEEKNRLNAMYYVLSCRESGTSDFKVQYFAVNSSCRIVGIADIIHKKIIEYNSKNRDRLYRKMLVNDVEETQRMIARGADPKKFQDFSF